MGFNFDKIKNGVKAVGGALSGNWGAAISGVAGLFANGASAAANYGMSTRQLKMQQDWQEYMSNTAHQREVADLKAAGLNPILSANNGASSGAASAGAFNTDFSNPVATAQQYKMNGKQIDNVQAITNKTNLEADHQEMENHFQPSILGAQLENIQAQTQTQTAQATLLAAQKLGQDIDNKWKDILNHHQVENLKASTYSLVQGAVNGMIAANAQATSAGAAQIGATAQANKTANEILLSSPEAAWIKHHPHQAEIVAGINRWTGALGNVIKANVGYNYSQSKSKSEVNSTSNSKSKGESIVHTFVHHLGKSKKRK